MLQAAMSLPPRQTSTVSARLHRRWDERIQPPSSNAGVDRLVLDAPTTPNHSTDATIDLGASIIQQNQTNKGH